MSLSDERHSDAYGRGEAYDTIRRRAPEVVEAIGNLQQIRSVEISYAKMLLSASDFNEEINQDVAMLRINSPSEAGSEKQAKNELRPVGETAVESLSEFVRAFYRYGEFSRAIGFPVPEKSAFNVIRVMRNFVEHVKVDIPVFYIPSARKPSLKKWKWDMLVDMVAVLSELEQVGKLMDKDAMKSLVKSSYNVGGYLNLTSAIETAIGSALNDYSESIAPEVDSKSQSIESLINGEIELSLQISQLEQNKERQLLSNQNIQSTKSWLVPT